jgi:hypothetical protein
MRALRADLLHIRPKLHPLLHLIRHADITLASSDLWLCRPAVCQSGADRKANNWHSQVRPKFSKVMMLTISDIDTDHFF